MAGHAEGLAFQQIRTQAGAGVLGGAVRRLVDRERVVAVHDFGRNAVGRTAVGHIGADHLLVERGRVGVLIVVADQDQRQLQDGGEVDAFVPIAAAGGAVAEEAERDAGVALVLLGERRARGHRDRCADGADDGHDLQSQVAHVHVAVAALREPADTSHVLSENLPGMDAADEIGRHVAVAGEQDVLGIGSQRRACGDCLLAAAYVDATSDLALPVELLFDPFLDFPHEEHVGVKPLGQLSVGVRHFLQQPAGPG